MLLLPVTTPTAPRLKLARFTAGLMNQQCWCWGCDVRRCDGNLLLAYGCERHRPVEGTTGSTCYVCGSGPHRVWLWGFGVVFLGEAGPVYVNRYDPRPRAVPLQWTDALHAHHRAAAFESLRRVQDASLSKLWHWIASYERWTIDRAGASYRDTCIGTWSKRRTVDGPAMGRAWSQLANIAASPACRQREMMHVVARLAR